MASVSVILAVLVLALVSISSAAPADNAVVFTKPKASYDFFLLVLQYAQALCTDGSMRYESHGVTTRLIPLACLGSACV